jgi:hypothetical protein
MARTFPVETTTNGGQILSGNAAVAGGTTSGTAPDVTDNGHDHGGATASGTASIAVGGSTDSGNASIAVGGSTDSGTAAIAVGGSTDSGVAAIAVGGSTDSGGASITLSGAVADGSTATMATEKNLAPPLAGVAIHAQVDDAAVTPIVAGFTQPERPRNAVLTFGAAWAASPGGDVTVGYHDQYGAARSEVVAAAPAGSTAMKGIIAVINSITFAAGAGGVGHKLDISTGDKLGILAPVQDPVGIGMNDLGGGYLLDVGMVFSDTAGQVGFTPTVPANAANNYAVTVPSTAATHSHALGTLAAADAGHTHGSSALTATDSGHDHGSSALTATDSGHDHGSSALTATDSGHDHSISNEATGLTVNSHTHTQS